MGTTRTFTTTIQFYGLDVDVDVEYTIYNWGSPGNGWDEPPEPVDFEIDRVTSTLTGRDLTELCQTYCTGPQVLVHEFRHVELKDQPRDRVQTALFGGYTSIGPGILDFNQKDDTKREFRWYGPRLREVGPNLMGNLYEQIADHGDALEPPEYEPENEGLYPWS